MHEFPFPVLLFVLFAALIIALAVFSSIARAKRLKALRAWTAQRGWRFLGGRDGAFDDRYPDFGASRHGSNRYACNIMQAPWRERDALAFDYHYETHSHDSKGRRKTHHHHFSAVIVNAGLALRPLHIRPESFFDKIAEFVGWDDIDFESAEFSRKFHVTSPDRKWA